MRLLFETAADGFERAGATNGCAVGAVALDVTAEDSELRVLCQSAFDDWATAIAPHLPFPGTRSRRSFATAIVVALEGAFVLARAARSGDPFRHAGRWLSAALVTAPTRHRRKRTRMTTTRRPS